MAETDSKADFLKYQAKHVRQCRREAWFVGIVITICMICTSTYMYQTGYLSPEQRPEQPELMFGIPAWVVCGLFFPWLAMIVVTWFFALFIMRDDEPYVDVPEDLQGTEP